MSAFQLKIVSLPPILQLFGSQLCWRIAHTLLSWVCGSCFFPWITIPSIKMVQEMWTWPKVYLCFTAARRGTAILKEIDRTALLSCGGLISNAFGSLIASGILDGMDGKLGRAAWRYVFGTFCSLEQVLIKLLLVLRWLFYIEGTLTIFVRYKRCLFWATLIILLIGSKVAFCALFILPDFPTTTSRWLSPVESRLAQRRIEEDFAGLGDEEQTEKGSAAGFFGAMTDWKVWWLALALTSMVVSLSFNAFFPTLSATMGFSRTVTLLLCAPVRYTLILLD